MQVFHIKEDKLSTAKEIPFRNEDELQNLIDNNLKEIFGLELIKSQYTLDDLRMDTVAFDSNNNAFVIIEYKNNANFSVVDQGYAYLNLLLDKKADLILLYREQTSKNLKKDDVDWSATRILFISPEFTKYSVRALNIDLPIELIEVHKYANGSLVLNRLEIKKQKGNVHTEPVLKSLVIQKVSREIKLYDEDYHFSMTSEHLKRIYQHLKEKIMALDENIVERPRKNYIGFIASTNFVDIHMTKGKLKLWLNMKKGELDDPQHLSRDVSAIGHWGNGDYEINVKDEHNLDYLMGLIEQSYKKNSS
jgi:predicted transport protein